MFLGLTKRIMVIDAETGSPVDINKEGQYRYWEHPETRTLMLSSVFLRESDPVELVDFEAEGHLTQQQIMAIRCPPEECLLAAANCEFDRAALKERGYDTPPEKWIDILVLAYILGFAGRLNDVLKQTPLNVTKNPEGTRLITLFSVQRTPWYHEPEKWEKFRQYCVQDTTVEAQLLDWCMTWLDTPMMRPSVQKILKQELRYREINRRGIPIDLPGVKGAIRIRDAELHDLMEEMKQITGLDNPNSRDQLLGWLRERIEIPDLTKATVRDTIEYYEAKGEQDPRISDALKVLRLRQETGKTSVKKFDAMLRATSDDGRLRGGWQFYGASRTGRIAGRVLNPANQPRPMIDNPELVAEWLAHGNREAITTLFPERKLLDTLASTIRACVHPRKGRALCVADLSSIESVGAAWLTGCKPMMDVFWEGQDAYKDFASRALQKPYDEVTKAERTMYKPAVLGGIYMLSGYGLQQYAQGMGVELDLEETNNQIRAFRSLYHELPEYWRQLKEASQSAVLYPGTTHEAKAVNTATPTNIPGKYVYTYKDWPKVSYYSDGTFLFCRLPSGRLLCYYRPSVREVTITKVDGDSFTTSALHYYGIDQKSPGNQWQEISVHAGHNLENINQAFCRDILWHGLEQVDDDPRFDVLGDVYDEILTEIDADDTGALKALIAKMVSRAPYLDDSFYLGADGFIRTRYGKD